MVAAFPGKADSVHLVDLLEPANKQVVMIGGSLRDLGEFLLDLCHRLSPLADVRFKEDLRIVPPNLGLRWALGFVALACRGTGISPEIPNTAKLWGDRVES